MKMRPYCQINQKKKRATEMAQAVSIYLASAEPWVQTLTPPQKKEKDSKLFQQEKRGLN
jgi:hypothetical protein